MPRLVPEQQPDGAVFLVVNDYRPYGIAYSETGVEEADRESIIHKFITGQYDKPVRVVAFNATEGWARDASEEIAREILHRATELDENLSSTVKSFIGRHLVVEVP